MNPSALLACLWLTGSALGAPAPNPDAPLDLRTLSPQERKRFEDARMTLQMMTYRFDDGDGAILSPRTHAPISLSRGRQLLDILGQGKVYGAIERMNAVLQGQDPGKPLSPQNYQKLDELERAAGSHFPPDLAKLLSASGAGPSKPLLDAFWTRYLGQRALSDQAMAQTAADAVEAPAGRSAASVRAAYFDAAEQRLGDKMRQDVAADLSQYETGRKLLAHFRNGKGVLELPAMLELRDDARYGAFYDSGAKDLVLNETYIVNAVVAAAPASQQAALRLQLSTPQAVADYLGKDDRAMNQFVQDNDIAIIHELTHAWQDRRDRVDTAMNRGMLPGADVIPDEWEAYRKQNELIGEQLARDPAGALRRLQAVAPNYLAGYERFVTDFRGWQDGITREYLATWPESAATLPQLQDLQKMREEAARQDGLFAQVKAYFGWGADAANARQTESDDDTARFEKQRYPAIRVQGLLALAQAYGEDEPDSAYRYASAAASAAESGGASTQALLAPAQRAYAAALSGAMTWLRRFRGDAQRRVDLVAEIEEDQDAMRSPLPKGFAGAKALAFCDLADDLKGKASQIQDPKAAYYARQHADQIAAKDRTPLADIDAELRPDVARCREDLAGPFASLYDGR